MFVYREVCTAGALFFILSAKQVTCWRKRLEGGKMKGRETFLSVSHLSCDARWVLFLRLFRKAGRVGVDGQKNKTKRSSQMTKCSA